MWVPDRIKTGWKLVIAGWDLLTFVKAAITASLSNYYRSGVSQKWEYHFKIAMFVSFLLRQVSALIKTWKSSIGVDVSACHGGGQLTELLLHTQWWSDRCWRLQRLWGDWQSLFHSQNAFLKGRVWQPTQKRSCLVMFQAPIVITTCSLSGYCTLKI